MNSQQSVMESTNIPQCIHEPQLITDHEVIQPNRFRKLRKLLGALALSTTVFVGGGTVGSMVTPAHTKIGPHEADMYITFDSKRTIDFGLPGSLSWPAQVGGHTIGFGVRFDINGIPIDMEQSESKGDYSEQAMRQYESFFSDPTKDREQIIKDGQRHFTSWGLGSIAVFNTALLGALIGGRRILDKSLRRQIADSIHAKRRGLRATVATTALLVGSLGAGEAILNNNQANTDTILVSSEFADTPLAGARIRGKLLADGLNKYGVDAMNFLEKNQKFYQSASDNLKLEFVNSPEVLQADRKHRLFLFEAGLHCNIGMSKVVGQAINLFKPDFILDGGDITFSGSSLEAVCLDTVHYHSRGRPIIFAPGNHDSDTTIKQAEKIGFKVLNGEVLEINGLRILGDSDPRHTAFGHAIGNRPNRAESVKQMGERLAVRAADDPKGVDILLANEPNAVEPTSRIGSAKLTLSGSFEQELAYHTSPYGRRVINFQGASTGGATPNRLTIGPLEDTSAQFTIFAYNRETGQVVACQTITVQPDTSVNIEPPILLGEAKI